jgi:hypothetical protein
MQDVLDAVTGSSKNHYEMINLSKLLLCNWQMNSNVSLLAVIVKFAWIYTT